MERLSTLGRIGRRSGLFDPLTVGSTVAAAGTWGASAAAPYAAAALRHPRRTAIIDPYGSITYRELDLRTSRLASGLQSLGVGRRTSVGLLCRNHRGFVEANIALAKLGVDVVYLNTGLPEAQLRAVIEREQITVVLADEEFEGTLDAADTFWARPGADPNRTFPEIPMPSIPLLMPRPWRASTPVVLTSGTSGAPKGTRRSASLGAGLSAASVLGVIPYERGDVFVIPAPLFHAWGLSQLVVSATLGGTAVLPGSFDPTEVAELVEANDATVLIAVPVMLHRMLEASASDTSLAQRLSTLRLTASSGSALPGDLPERWMDTCGDHLYSLYGSTEVGQVSVATPEDLRAAPGTAGRPLPGVRVRLVDHELVDVPVGRVGRILVESSMHFDGYTSGGTKPTHGSHMEIGDQGRFDADGRLFVVGRADDMIITGGENVYPVNIETSLLAHAKVVDAVVVGVPDDDLGQRVRAVIVTDGTKGTARLTASIKAHLSNELARYEVPREFVYRESLPRNPAGKILRGELVASDDSSGGR